MKRQRTNQKIFKIFDLVSQQIAEVFPYILGFYIVCLIISLFSERWKLFFNWSAFHVSVILLGILVLSRRQGNKLFVLSPGLKGRKFFNYQKKILKDALPKFKNQPVVIKGLQTKISFIGAKLVLLKDKWGKVWQVFKTLLFISRGVLIALIKGALRLLFDTIYNLAESLTGKNLIKIGVLAVILIFLLFRQINPINFLVLAYALISILFVVESRVSATIALLFLFFCPILLIAKKDPLAEKMAIYAYDFLIIAALARLREYQREEKAKKVIHSH